MGREVVFVVRKDPAGRPTGHFSYVRAHARAAISAGFEPHLFCVSREEGVVETDYGVMHQLKPSLRHFAYDPGMRIPSFAAPLHSSLVTTAVEQFLLDRKGPQVIHGFGLWGGAGVTAGRNLQRRGLQVSSIISAYTTTEHEYEGRLKGLKRQHGFFQRFRIEAEFLWVRSIVDRYEGEAYLGARFVMVNYEAVRKLLVSRYGSQLKLRMMPYTSETAFLRGASKEQPELPASIATLKHQSAPLVVAISRHDPRKGVDVFIRALAELHAIGVPFRACLVGAGPLLKSHRRLVKQLNLADIVVIEGFVPDSYLYLQNADIFVLPSLEEGSGSVALIEAMQAGVAVIASNVDGIPEDVADGESALLVEPGNVSALSHAIARVIRDPELRQRLAHKAREIFSWKFAPHTLSSALRETYAELGLVP